MLAPILALIAFIGVYPKPFLERIEPSARKIVDQLDNDVHRDVPVPPVFDEPLAHEEEE